MTVGVLAAIGHTLGGVAGLWEFYRVATGHHSSTASPTSQASSRPFRSIAVLPVRTSATSPDEKELADRVTREVTSMVSRVARDGYVVSYGLAQKFAEGAVDPRRVGQELNVRYIVEGRVTPEAGRHQLRIELIDSLDGSRLWEDQQVLNGLDALTETIARIRKGLSVALGSATKKEISSLPKEKRAAWELLMKAREMGYSIEDARQAQRLVEEALRIDPTLVPALFTLGAMYWQRAQNEPEARNELAVKLDDLSNKAVRLAPADPRVWSLRSQALRLQFSWSAAFAANDEALRLDPYRVQAIWERAGLLISTGRTEESLPLLDRALTLDPNDDGVLISKCIAYVMLSRDGEALPLCERGAAIWNNWLMFSVLTAVHANLGNAERSQYWKRRLVEANPKYSIARAKATRMSDIPEYWRQAEHWADGLRKAGIPEN